MSKDPAKKILKHRFRIRRRRIEGLGEEQGVEEEFAPDKIIYVELDDEITTLFDKIKNVQGKKVALVIPKRAVVLQSVVNLKILNKKINEIDKEIIIITADPAGLMSAEKVGIPALERLFEKAPVKDPEVHTIASRTDQRPVRIEGKKVSIAQVIHGNKTNFLASVMGKMRERFRDNKKKRPQQDTRLVFVAPNKQALITLILVSVLLLLAIAYIALPGATVYITPRSSILDPSFNVSFLDHTKNRDALENNRNNVIAIATQPVKPSEFTRKITHPGTGKLFKGENARGIITIVNLSNAPWDLAERTRFQTEDGIVFRIPQSVRVPPSRGGVNGTLDVSVVADEYDTFGQIVGARGNIGPTRFFLPGFKNDENRKNLYGESKGPMTGGTTKSVKMITQEDINAAVENIKREVQKSAVDELGKFLEQENLLKKTNLSLLTDKHAMRISEPKIVVPDVAGKPLDQFEVTAIYTASGTAFDRQELIEALKDRLTNRVDPDKKILKIDEKDISYKFLDEDGVRGVIRLTATMRAIQMYELDPEKENGHRFIKKITDHIAGMRIEDAITYLQQQTDEISRVEITTWPVWAPTIPNIADNIKFVIREEDEMGLQ